MIGDIIHKSGPPKDNFLPALSWEPQRPCCLHKRSTGPFSVYSNPRDLLPVRLWISVKVRKYQARDTYTSYISILYQSMMQLRNIMQAAYLSSKSLKFPCQLAYIPVRLICCRKHLQIGCVFVYQCHCAVYLYSGIGLNRVGL